MPRQAAFVMPTDPVGAVARRMRDENVGFLPVCDRSRKVIGTVTDRDLTLRVLAPGRDLTTPVGDVMSPDVVTCGPEDDLHHAEHLLVQHKKARIVCVDGDGRLEGVISLSDIAQQEHEEERLARTMRGITSREAPPG